MWASMKFLPDIEKPFLQVALSEVDRDATRFLWIKKLQEPIDAERNIECYRFRRVLFGAFPSPFLLAATLRHHLDKQKDDWVTEDLKNSMYVDNVLSGASNVTTQSIITVIHDSSWLVQE